MVAAVVLATFIIFVLVDYYLQTRRPEPQFKRAGAARVEAGELPFPLSVVGGFKLPAHLSYHPGHTWAAKESHRLVRIGLDDFAARLIGQLDHVDLPARGRWLRQGERAWTVSRGDHQFEMVSPIEGEVIDVNPEIVRDPSLAHSDPYGSGWLLAVHAPAAEGNLKNLLRGRLAQRWMEESVSSLQTQISPGSELRLQDGGHAIPDVLSSICEDKWEQVVRDLLLG
jgi:glycine cleavage system H lipoate-binding protein